MWKSEIFVEKLYQGRQTRSHPKILKGMGSLQDSSSNLGDFANILATTTNLIKKRDDIVLCYITDSIIKRFEFPNKDRNDPCIQTYTTIKVHWNPWYEELCYALKPKHRDLYFQNALNDVYIKNKKWTPESKEDPYFTNIDFNTTTPVADIVKDAAHAVAEAFTENFEKRSTMGMFYPLFAHYIVEERSPSCLLYRYEHKPDSIADGYDIAYVEEAHACTKDKKGYKHNYKEGSIIPNTCIVFGKKSGGQHIKGSVAHLVDQPIAAKQPFENQQIVARKTGANSWENILTTNDYDSYRSYMIKYNPEEFIPLRTSSGKIVTISHLLPFRVDPQIYNSLTDSTTDVSIDLIINGEYQNLEEIAEKSFYNFTVNEDGTTDPPIQDI